MFKNIRKQRLVLLLIGLAIVIGASLPSFMTASCLTHVQTPAEARALDSLRAMTRKGVLPSEDVVARIESQFPRSKAAALARLVRARIRVANKDFPGAAQLLNTSVVNDYSLLGDYALFMRADALEQAGDKAGARAAYEQLLHDYPSSLRARDAALRAAGIAAQSGNAAAVSELLKDLIAADDPAALLLVAKAKSQSGDTTQALANYRRIYFFAPTSAESGEAATAIQQSSSLAPATAAEALARADKLYEGKRYADAAQAYADAANRFPATVNPQMQLRRGIAAANARKNADAIAALSSIPVSAGDTRAEALFTLAQTYARARQWEQARATVQELQRSFPTSPFAPRALVSVGQIAEDAKNDTDASYFLRTAVNSFSGAPEVAQAQFDLAWIAHNDKNFAESSTQLTEHLAYYADKNTDNRGRAGYWAARDSERAGKTDEARALYQAMLGRYDANWYGYLAKQRLAAMDGSGSRAAKTFAPNSVVGRAIANLQTVTVAEEPAGTNEDKAIAKASELTNVGLDDWALEQLDKVSASMPNSPKINLAIAQVYRAQEDNVRALNVLKKSFPDYSQMKPEEMTREQWDVFYPLSYWDIIVQESRARNLDPFQVAGLIRQETVFNPRARSGARAYGLMQVLIPTATLTARKYGVDRSITEEALYEPRLNIQLGTAYLRDQIDKFGRIEYVAAAYNAGPFRVVQWQASLPSDLDEWAEAVPFKETRGYIQGVVRNRLQYERLYDANGKFRSDVGARAVTERTATPSQSEDPTIRRNVTDGDHEE
ncbi:MAG TPA: transglycosylase SLT domain-containing protein [Pyrinomonadaceae bacterium]|nr:transglycosylase SLT domain-containing protein [Pyrinomonadaceae bacterium]